MKTFVLALIVVVLALTQVLTPASASAATVASATTVAAAACGDTYTVLRGDYLTKIANTCGVTLATLINANPEIKNINLLYAGQVIRIKNDASIPVTGGGTYVVQSQDTLFKIAVRFGTTVDVLLKLNPGITNASVIYVGQVINLPGTTVVTGRRVSLSATSVKVGATVTVTATGFPANADLDFRVARQGYAYSAVVDGKTDAAGAGAANIVIPTTAASGQSWVVTVLTTSIKNGVEVTSPVMTIIP